MKRVAILCQTGPGGKRRLAEEALRVAAGLTATGRVRIDLILSATALALLQPELGGPVGTWESSSPPKPKSSFHRELPYLQPRLLLTFPMEMSKKPLRGQI